MLSRMRGRISVHSPVHSRPWSTNPLSLGSYITWTGVWTQDSGLDFFRNSSPDNPSPLLLGALCLCDFVSGRNRHVSFASTPFSHVGYNLDRRVNINFNKSENMEFLLFFWTSGQVQKAMPPGHILEYDT